MIWPWLILLSLPDCHVFKVRSVIDSVPVFYYRSIKERSEAPWSVSSQPVDNNIRSEVADACSEKFVIFLRIWNWKWIGRIDFLPDRCLFNMCKSCSLIPWISCLFRYCMVWSMSGFVSPGRQRIVWRWHLFPVCEVQIQRSRIPEDHSLFGYNGQFFRE